MKLIKRLTALLIILFLSFPTSAGTTVQAATKNVVFEIGPSVSDNGATTGYAGGKVYYRIGKGSWKEVGGTLKAGKDGQYRISVKKGKKVSVKVVPDKNTVSTFAEFGMLMDNPDSDREITAPVNFDHQAFMKKLKKKSGFKFKIGDEKYKLLIQFENNMPQENDNTGICFDDAVSFKKNTFTLTVRNSDVPMNVKLKVSSNADFTVEKPSEQNGNIYVLNIAPEDFSKLKFTVDKSFDPDIIDAVLRGANEVEIPLVLSGSELTGIEKYDLSKDSHPHFSLELSPQSRPKYYIDFSTYGKMSSDGQSASFKVNGKTVTVTVSKGGGFKDGKVGIPEDLGKVVFKLSKEFDPSTMVVTVGERRNVGYDPMIVDMYVKKGTNEVTLARTDAGKNTHYRNEMYFNITPGKSVVIDK